jgi:hypothetical protein
MSSERENPDYPIKNRLCRVTVPHISWQEARYGGSVFDGKDYHG